MGEGQGQPGTRYQGTVAMKTYCRIPHVEEVAVTRAHVMRRTFDDGLVRELEFMPGSNRGTVFAPLDDPEYFAQVRVDPESRTESACETCAYFETGPEYVPVLIRQRDHAREHAQPGRAELFDGLLRRITGTGT